MPAMARMPAAAMTPVTARTLPFHYNGILRIPVTATSQAIVG
jgi:hypothetical protein